MARQDRAVNGFCGLQPGTDYADLLAARKALIRSIRSGESVDSTFLSGQSDFAQAVIVDALP